MSEEAQAPQGVVPLMLPPANIQVIMKALGKLPYEEAAPTVNLLGAQIQRLAQQAVQLKADQDAAANDKASEPQPKPRKDRK